MIQPAGYICSNRVLVIIYSPCACKAVVLCIYLHSSLEIVYNDNMLRSTSPETPFSQLLQNIKFSARYYVWLKKNSTRIIHCWDIIYQNQPRVCYPEILSSSLQQPQNPDPQYQCIIFFDQTYQRRRKEKEKRRILILAVLLLYHVSGSQCLLVVLLNRLGARQCHFLIYLSFKKAD